MSDRKLAGADVLASLPPLSGNPNIDAVLYGGFAFLCMLALMAGSEPYD